MTARFQERGERSRQQRLKGQQCGDTGTAAAGQRSYPATSRTLLACCRHQGRACPFDQQGSQIAITPFADAEQYVAVDTRALDIANVYMPRAGATVYACEDFSVGNLWCCICPLVDS
jgi:hypothetical protein